MKEILFVLALSLLLILPASAHRDRTDECGGHRDVKQDSYHFHDYSKWCKCHPEKCFNEGVKAAEDFEKLLFLSSPQARDFISFVDSALDGHLIVWIKKRTLSATEAIRDSLYKSILNIWRDTKYVREQNYGDWIEVKYHNIGTGEIQTIKNVK